MSEENHNESSNTSATRASNIQKILDRKQKIFNLPRNSKLFKISTYSTCQYVSLKTFVFIPYGKFFIHKQEKGCKCVGFKLSEEQRKKDESSYLPQNKDLCSNTNCSHPFCK